MEPRLDARFYQSMSAGRALAMQARPLEALKEFENAISICGTNAGAWFGKGQCLLDLERFPAAVAAFQTARELAPEVISTRVMFAKVLQHVGRNVEAAEEARALLQRHPDSLVAHEVLISALASEGEYEQILETAARAERMVSGTPQNRLLQGRLWDTLGCPEAAELAFREALRIQPDNGKAWQELGAAQMDQRKYIEAVTSLSRAFGDPTFKGRSTLRYLVTSVALLNGEADLGEKQFENFLIEERRTPALHGSSPGIQKAFASLRKRDARRSQTHDLLAKLFLETGRRDEVIPALETSLHLNPTNGSTWLALAQACCMRLRFDRAVEAAGKAIELDPKEGDAHFWLGWAHCALGQPSAARAAFHRAEQLKAAPGRVQLALAGLEMRDGNRTQAERHLGRARQLSPDLPMKFAEDPGKFIQDFRPIERAAAQWLRDRRAAAR